MAIPLCPGAFTNNNERPRRIATGRPIQSALYDVARAKGCDGVGQVGKEENPSLCLRVLPPKRTDSPSTASCVRSVPLKKDQFSS